MKKGIDISYAQGTVNWDKVKAAGVEFAILRAGYGDDIASQDDKQYLRNVAECERVGMPWGVYLYSYARTLAQAESEAAHVLRLLKGRSPQYPVYIDVEENSPALSVQDQTAICVRFCEIVKAAGYIPGVYANLSWTRTRLDMEKLAPYEFWLAQYNDEPTYTGDFGMWQYISAGVIDGISGRVDLNYCYKEYVKDEPKPDVSWDTKSKSMIVGGTYAALCVVRNTDERADVRTDNPEVCAIERHGSDYTARSGQEGELYTIRAVGPGTCRIIASITGDSASFPVTVSEE